MVNTYVLVNPHIEGEFNNKTKAMNSDEAATKFYKNLSEHFNNSVPSFYFSIQKGSSGDGKYYHFQVKEKRSNEEVSFDINPYNIKGGNNIKSFQTKLANFKSKFNQDAGSKSKKHGKSHKKHKDKDDESSSSSSESSDVNLYRRAKMYGTPTAPIHYWWYDPYLYNLDSLFIPTFYSYVTPYIELSLLASLL